MLPLANVAVQAMSLSSIVTLRGLDELEQSPDQPANVEPGSAVAVTLWLVPKSYVPPPPTVPLPVLEGLILTVRLCWLTAKAAVTVQSPVSAPVAYVYAVLLPCVPIDVPPQPDIEVM